MSRSLQQLGRMQASHMKPSFEFVVASATVFFAVAGCYREPDVSSPARRHRLVREPSVDVTESDAKPQPSGDDSPVADDDSPRKWVVSYREGVRLLEAGEYDGAIEALNETITLVPKFSLAYINRGFVHRKVENYEQALSDLQQGMELDSGLAGYMPQLYVAEILAACPKDRFRDGAKAVEIATKGCEKTAWKHGAMLAVLAAAYAEKGDFKAAVKWQTEAGQHVKDSAAAEMDERLELYRAGKPCRRLFAEPRGMSR